jgi:hypothetical protein
VSTALLQQVPEKLHLRATGRRTWPALAGEGNAITAKATKARRKDRAMSRKTPSKTEVLRELETMLKDVLAATGPERSYARMARAHGYVDGFMRGLLDSGFASKEELLELVARERTRASGPATERLDDAAERIVAA